jgi:hypothetical protein
MYDVYTKSRSKTCRIEKALEEMSVWQYVSRIELKKERDSLLRRLARPPAITEHKKIPYLSYKASSSYYSPIELYTQHHDSHSDRQQFRKDKEVMLLTQIREQQAIIILATNKIKELKGILETVRIEADNSSDEEYSKLLEEARKSPIVYKGV